MTSIEPKKLTPEILAGNDVYWLVEHSPPVMCASQRTSLLPLIFKLPAELLQMVVEFLEPIWMFQLEEAYSKIREGLSYPGANAVWYRSLPPSLWLKKACFQLGTHGGRRLFRRRIIPKGFNRSARGHVYLPSLHDYDDQGLNNNAGTTANIRSSSNSHESSRALGGPYCHSIDYRREILGHLHDWSRCHVCLSHKEDPDGAPYPKLEMCNKCTDEYTIDETRAREVIGRRAESLLEISPDTPSQSDPSWAPCLFYGGRYYLPMVDQILRGAIGMDYKAAEKRHTALAEYAKYLSAEWSSEEVFRRRVRRRIVQIAERMWDGWDPTPIEHIDPVTQRHVVHPRPLIARLAAFRTRFAPTYMLHKFLFPDFKLCDNPRWLEWEEPGRWLPDPTMHIRTAEDTEHATQHWLIFHAESMIERLAWCESDDYDKEGYGGTVSTWVEQATAYHVRRFERIIDDVSWFQHPATQKILVLNYRLGVPYHPLNGPYELGQCHDRFLAQVATKVKQYACYLDCECLYNNRRHGHGLDVLVLHMWKHHKEEFYLWDAYQPAG
ncbi:hypothetical protein VTN00DRAFT_665 [Thermoascus crustaceus]|uniref:uncharacterized protein n=1 Tax=Thermoascus crustaceus TaxID=5088 RepID=UPI003743367F